MPTRRPNILLIVLDTLRRDRLSIYGYERGTSPEFDAFAADSVLFERAIAPAQWTVPSHASMFTGVYPSVHGVTQSASRLPNRFPTLAELLQGAGYHTVAFCNNPLVGVLDNGLQRGFERFYNYSGASPNRPFDTSNSFIRRALTERFRRFARPIQNSFAHSDTLFRLSLHPWLVPLWTRYVNYKGHTSNSVDDLVAYWRHYMAGGVERPLFVFLNLMGVHLPYNPPQDYVDRVASDLSSDRHAYTFMRRFNADAARWASPPDPPLREWEQRVLSGFYDAEIAHQDHYLGRLLRQLRMAGALENTMVVIAADHGEAHGDHGLFGHGFGVYQELVHVPLVVHYPERFVAGRRVTTNVSTRRLFHTILDVASVQSEEREEHGADLEKLSLCCVADGHPDIEGGVAFTEAIPPETFIGVLQHRNPSIIERLRLRLVRRGVYDGAYKLVVVGDDIEGLFDVSRDPTETHDLAGERSSLATVLQQKLNAFAAVIQLAPDVQQSGEGVVSGAVVEHLRALGYID